MTISKLALFILFRITYYTYNPDPRNATFWSKTLFSLNIYFMFIYLMFSVQHSPVHRYKPVTLYKLYRTWHRVISVYTAPVTEHHVRASDWSAGPIQSSDWPTPWTDTRVGPNNCSLHNNVQSTQHLHLAALFWSQQQQRWRHGEWIMQTGVRTLWSVTW